MGRLIFIALTASVVLFAAVPIVSAQVQPVIVFIGRSILGGFASGVAHKAGEEFYDRARGHANDAPQPSPGSAPGPRSPPSYTPPPVHQTIPSPPVAAAPPVVPPDGIKWGFRNLHGNVIGLQLYARRQHGRNVWPSAEQAYLFKPGEHFEIRARCIPGELVCFGAWSQGRYWGTGYRMSHSCTSCCRTCGSSGGLNLR
jgi:hypothetical protein